MTRDRTQLRRSPRGVLHYIGLGLSGALLLAVIALAAVVIVIPKLAGATPLTVLTSSMEPGFPPGTLIVIQPVDPTEVAIGDVVTYQIRSGDPDLITHRVILVSTTSAGDRSFQLQGDNNGAPDADLVVPGQIQGRLWYSIPFVGYANAAMNGEARVWIIPIAAVLLFGYAGFMVVSSIRSAVRTRRARASGRP